ncbi:hypothetical protein Egran_02402 [Elaphomyces granulatus]|uniref:D-xylose 1-dehydrogenase (NADP(+), D-xylono-1,5-lactone-forming) n=1 Tax=Elaphomyces granulatus TaxID=519963 RepID=A0A232M0I5_9EURO|nr:hypothetical protein Egran_02402 [Elaphomyces granulatus]
MALALQAITLAQQYILSWLHPVPSKSPSALRLGVLSSADINPAVVIRPSQTHPDVILYGIATRDLPTAQKAARHYGFRRAYGCYQDLLDDPTIDIVHLSTPNSTHFELATRAILKGKHVLCEMPFTSNAEEARQLVEMSKVRGVIVEEAFHWQFHPSAHLFRVILSSGKYGRILRTDATITTSPGIPGIRWEFDLAGGSALDLTYALSFTRFAIRAGFPREIQSAVVRPSKKDHRVDEALYALLLFEDPKGHLVHSRIYTDMARSWAGAVIPRIWELPSIEVETEKAIIYFYNAMMPHVYHFIAITEKATGDTHYCKQYCAGPLWGNAMTTGGKGGKSYWSTYRWQLEAFVDAVRGEALAYWIPSEESIIQMETIDAIYRAAELPVRLFEGLKEL